MTGEQVDPSWDPNVRAKVQSALNRLLFNARDVLTRYADEDFFYIPPSEVTDTGDVTGLINAARNQVIWRLQDELARATATLDAVASEIEQHKRRTVGLEAPDSVDP